MTTDAEQLTPIQKIIGNAIVIIVLVGLVGAVIYGFVWLSQYTRAQTQAAKIDCIEHGGKVTEYTGGFTSWACVGLERIR